MKTFESSMKQGRYLDRYTMILCVVLSFIFYLTLHMCKQESMLLTDFFLAGMYFLILYRLYKKNIFIFEEMWFLISILISFSLVGNYLFFGRRSLIIKIIYFFLLNIELIPISNYVANFFSLNGQIINRCFDLKKRKKFFIIYLTITFLIEVVYLIAFNPGIIGYDTYGIVYKILNNDMWSESNGLFYYFCLNFILSFTQSYWAISIIQILFYCFIYALIASWMISCFMTRKTKIIFAFFSILFALLPNNAIMAITITHDIPYAISLMWFTYCIIRLKKESSNLLYIEMSISALLILLFRQNGFIIVPLTMLFAILFYPKKMKYLIAVFSAVLCFVLINAGIKNHYEYYPSDAKWKYVAGLNDMMGVYYNGGNFSDDTRNMIEETITDELNQSYTPYWTFHEYFTENASSIRLGDFLIAYLDTFARNPFCTIEMMLKRVDMMWDFSLGKLGTESWQFLTATNSTYYGEVVPSRQMTILNPILLRIGNISLQHPLKEILWRPAAMIILSLVIMVPFLIKDPGYIVWFSPIIANIVFNCLGLAWSHFRYYWGMQIVAVIIIAACILEKHLSKAE